MNLIIFFDNNSFKLNNVIIKYIKRLLLYEIVSSEFNDNKYENIILYKTNPTLIEINLKSNNYFNIQNIITNINNVIYKCYETYGTINFKKIIDQIYNIEKNNLFGLNTNKIILITSINDFCYFTDSNIIYTNDLLNEIKLSTIQFINISNFSFLKNLFPKIDEYFVDNKNYKIENIFEKSPFEFYNFDYQKDKLNELINILSDKLVDKLEDSKSLLLNNDELINITNNIDILKYFIVLCGYIEVNIIELIKSSDDLNKIKKIMRLFFETGDICLNNIIKSIINSINETVYRLSNSIIKLPVDKLEVFLSETYIKYILEFYEIVYPKIYNFNNSNNTFKKLNKKLVDSDKISTQFSPIKIKQIDNVKTDIISSQYLTSTLSLTNWIEEYNNYNPFGFLIKYKPNKFSYKGILDIGSSIFKTYPNLIIEEVTTNWVSLYDYYQIILTDFNTENNYQTDVFNIGNFNIIDNLLGNGNVFLPVYINKNHWELTKSIWTYHMSFINNCFEFEYNKKMDNIYFYTLLKLFINIKQIYQTQNFKSKIRLFCYVLRTSIQIMIDNKYLHSIKKEYHKFIELILKNQLLEKNSNFSDLIIRLIQLIISNECDQIQLEDDLKKVTNYIFSNYIISNYKMDFWEIINDDNVDIETKNLELECLKNSTLEDNISWLYLEFDLRLLNKIIKSIYQLKGFNRFIKIIDLTNGCVCDESVCDEIESNTINLINIEGIIKQVFSEQFNLNYYQVDISKYLISK